MFVYSSRFMYQLGAVTIRYSWLLPLIVLLTVLVLSMIFPIPALAEGGGGSGTCSGC